MKQRIMVIGCPGSGKSTLSNKLHNNLGIPLYHLDEIKWQNSNKSIDSETFEEILKNITQLDEWIIDGNYNSTLELRMREADIVIWLNYSRAICIFRVFKRFLQSFYRKSEGGNPKRVSWSFIKFVWNFKDNNDKRLLDLKDKYSNQNEWIILKSKYDTKLFCDKLQES
ncbi:topology modulation protein [Mammaliicoccus sciuri]|uniref:topology modulation protein n=1 Tax=Mammaliicoccus sciuri TaxID=1296 RepID=UPI001E4DA645|nr:topology modulation protein [Mammaliicoccus sciuri]MCD8893608.1 topology modulation protein [Mammaliicoccus sciuri]MCD8911797.1 topology modulation protein [Mammaliicoccus sciuri]